MTKDTKSIILCTLCLICACMGILGLDQATKDGYGFTLTMFATAAICGLWASFLNKENHHEHH